MVSFFLRHCDRAIFRYPLWMARLRYFYAFGASVSLAITWTLTIFRLNEPLPMMAYVFSLATTANLTLALKVLLIAEITWKLKPLTWIAYDWLMWAAIVMSVQCAAAFAAALGFEFYYGVTRRRGINLGVVSTVTATVSWIFLFWRTCVVGEANQRRFDEVRRRKRAMRNAGA